MIQNLDMSENHSTEKMMMAILNQKYERLQTIMTTTSENAFHRFNEKGIEGIISKIHKHKSIKFTDSVKKQIVDIATKNPRKHYGLPFSTWSLLNLLAGFIMKEMKLVDSISHAEIRNILLKHGIRWRKSKTVLENSKTQTMI